MTFATILGFCAVLSYLSFRNAFFGLKLMAGMAWFTLFMYIKDNPPDSIVEGSGVHTALLVVIIGFGLMVVLAGLGRGTKSTKLYGNGNSQTSESFKWKLPDWMNATQGETQVQATRRRQEETDNYRDQMHQALNQPKRRRQQWIF